MREREFNTPSCMTNDHSPPSCSCAIPTGVQELLRILSGNGDGTETNTLTDGGRIAQNQVGGDSGGGGGRSFGDAAGGSVSVGGGAMPERLARRLREAQVTENIA